MQSTLDLYWNSDRGDNFTTATDQGREDAEQAGYSFVRREAYVYPNALPGFVPLKLYYNSAREDNFVTGTAQGEADALAAGYNFVRDEGWVSPQPGSGLTPLKLFWSEQRQDNFLTATAQGEADALAAGYGFVRIEGYGALEASLPSSDVDAIRAYIDGLPRLAIVEPLAGRVEPIPGLQPGVSGKQRVEGKYVNRKAELGLLKSPGDVIWPGALVQGSSIASNNFSPILLSRPPGRIRLVGEFIVDRQQPGQHVSLFRDVPVMRGGEVQDARNEILSSLNAQDVMGTQVLDKTVAGTIQEAMVKLGFAYKAGGDNVNITASVKTSFDESVLFYSYIQKFYSVLFEPDAIFASPFFSDAVTLEEVKRFCSPGNPPLYVSEVHYGRSLIIQFSAKMSKTDLEAHAAFTFGKYSGNVDANFMEKQNRLRITALAIGGDGKLSATALASLNDRDGIQNALNNFILGGPQFSLQNRGAPVAFTMRYLGRGSDSGPYELAIAQMVTDESPEILDLQSTPIKHSFQVWRGRGGGWKDTGLTLNPGDHLRFSARGTTKNNRVFGQQIVGPNGWQQDIPGALDYKFPLGNRPPHAFIARLGARNNTGIDQTGGPNIAHVSSGPGPSDSFFVGEGTELTVGNAAANDDTDRAYANFGPLFLGINDSEAVEQGDPSYKLDVDVFVTRKIY